MSRIRRLNLIALLTTLLIAVGAPTFAASPLATSGIVTDPNGWLSDSDRARIESAARDARAKGITVDVVIVDDLSGIDGVEWCRQTLKKSGTTDGNIIYYLAYSQREDGECVNGGSVSQSARDNARRAAEAKLTSNPLTSSDGASGAVAFIDSLTNASTSSPSATSRNSRRGNLIGGSFGPSIVVFLALITFGGIGFLIASTSKRRGGVTEEVTRTSIDDSHKKVTQANHQLLAADEQVRSAADELDFARAQFGIAQTDEFARTLEFAKESVARCFETQKQMNGSTNPTARANLATSIMRDLGTSMNPLSNIQASFENKRSEQATLPTRISDARERLTEQRADLERAKAELVSIAGIYPPQMLASLQDNPEQAAALLDTADKALGEAQQMVETDRARAESSLDTAHRALMMATHQTDAIFSAKSDLDAIHDRLGAAIGSISSDITDTSALKADSAVFDPLVSDAHAAIADGQAALLNNGDPLAALEHLRSAEANLDAALAPLRTQRDNDERARSTARSQMALAESALTRAQRYVQGRRGAMDLAVRSTLNDSEQALKAAREALDSDPNQATSLAAQSRTLADRVLATPLSRPQYSWPESEYNYERDPGRDSGPSLGEQILWSILTSSGGSSRRSSWGSSSSSWGSSSSRRSSSSHHSSGGFSGSSGSFGGGFSGSKGHF